MRICLASESQVLSTEPGYGKQTINISCSYLQNEDIKELLEIKEDSTFLVYVCGFMWEEVQGHSPQIEPEPSRKEEKGGDSGWLETTTWPSPVVHGLFPMSQVRLPSSRSSFPAPVPSGEPLQATSLPGQGNERANM